MPADIDRRKFMKATGVAGAGLLAGCTGNGDDDVGDGDDGDADAGNGDGNGEDDEFPQQTVELLIPYGPGGGYDDYVRLLAPYLADYLGGEVQPQNVEGAGGRIATENVYNSDPDGHTTMIVNVSDFAINQIQEDVDYNLMDMTWFAQIAEDLRGIGVAQHAGIETFDEFVEAVQNEELRWYSPGPGSGQVIVPAVLGEVAGLYPAENITNNVVTYDGRGEAFQGMLSGDVEAMAGTYHSVLPFTEDGEVEMIMTFTMDDEPPEQTPNSATLGSENIENGQEILDTVTGRRAFAGPPGISDSVTETLRDAYEGAINDDDFLDDAAESERPINYMGGEDTASAVANMIEQWEDNPDLLDAVFY